MANRENLFLVIGREDEIRPTLRDIIEESFTESVTVLSSDGIDGIHLARESMPDVILVNHMPPDTDAFAICRQIRKDNTLHEIPVIITAEDSGDNEILSRAIESGCDAFLKSPADKLALIFQLQSMLACRAVRQNRQSERESLRSELQKREEELKTTQNQMRKGEEFEALISGIATQFVNLSPDLIDDRLKETQRTVCSFMGIDISTIFLYDDFAGQIVLKHLYTSDAISLTPEDYDADRHFPWCKKQLLAGQIVNVASTASLPEEALIDRQSWDYYGIRSSLAFPFMVQGRFFGSISFDMLREMKIRPMNLIRQLNSVVQIFGGALSKKYGSKQLADREERFRSLIESTDDLIWVVDPVRFGLVTFNSAVHYYFRTVRGIDVERGMLPKELFQEASAIDWEQMYTKALIDGPYKREYVTTSGKTLLVSIFPMKIDDKISAISVFGQDITRVRATSLSLKRSKERYQKAQEMGHFGHWSFDPTTQELLTSPETSRIYGFPVGKVINYETLISCISEKDAKRVKKGFILLLKDGAALNQEFEIRKHGTGETRYVWVIADMQKDESGIHDIVSGVVQDITKRKKLEQELMDYREHLEDSNKMLAHRLEQSIAAISKIAELRDAYTAGHQRRVKELACAIAAEMGLSGETIKNISYGAIIHDIGKIYIASDILNKPGKISGLEYQLMQTHVAHGYDVAIEIGFSSEIPTMILQHHERIDGSGYPNGLTGDKLLLESKILGVSDVVEAMTSHRPYRPALGIDAALEEIAAFSGQKYDSTVVEVCIRLFREKGFAFS